MHHNASYNSRHCVYKVSDLTNVLRLPNGLCVYKVTNRIYLYCPVVTEKSTNTECQINLVHAEACRGMDKLIWHEG